MIKFYYWCGGDSHWGWESMQTAWGKWTELRVSEEEHSTKWPMSWQCLSLVSLCRLTEEKTDQKISLIQILLGDVSEKKNKM